MNKETLSKLVGERLDKSPSEVKENLEAIFETIREQLSEGEAVQIVGFGKFNVKKRKARMGRDPNTGEKLYLPETDTPSFSPSKNLTRSVKGKEV